MGSLRAMLKSWYSSEQRESRNHTRVESFQLGMLGKPEAPSCDLHGAETLGVLRFVDAILLPEYGHNLAEKQGHYCRAIGSCVKVLDLIRENDWKMSAADAQTFCDCICVHLRSLKALSIPCKPKHHAFLEMGFRFSGRTHLHRSPNWFGPFGPTKLLTSRGRQLGGLFCPVPKVVTKVKFVA